MSEESRGKLGSAPPATPAYSRREFARLLASLATVPFARPGVAQPASVPSFLFFLSDDLGYGDLACYGHPINRTPHLDRLASEGMRFIDAHAASSVCSPSRAALLTGRHPYRLGFYYILEADVHLRREEVCIASLLKDRGYDTAFVGKWHVSQIGEDTKGQPDPHDFGFDHWFATEHNAFDGPRNPKGFIRNGRPVAEVDGWYCDVIVREALGWLRARRDPRRPFFLMVNSHEPHTPVSPPDEFRRMYDTPEVERLAPRLRYGGVDRPDRGIWDHASHYYGTVTQLDAAFGHLMSGLAELALADRTLVVFTSDNGPEYPVNWMESGGRWNDPLRDRSFGTPGPLRGMKRFTYEGGHRVPLIMRWPGRIPAGAVSDALVNGTDFFPTFAEFSGATPPADRTIDGASLVPLFSGGAVRRTIPASWAFPVPYAFTPHFAMREEHWVILAWFDEKPPDQRWMDWIKSASPRRYELYDLGRDLSQRENLADKEPVVTARLAVRLNELWRDIRAEAPVWKEWQRR
jgi:arylsulfatase A